MIFSLFGAFILKIQLENSVNWLVFPKSPSMSVEMHLLETLLLLSVYEERNHRLFSSLLAFPAVGGLSGLLHISAHKELHCRIRKDTEKTALLIPLAMLNGFVVSVIETSISVVFLHLSAFPSDALLRFPIGRVYPYFGDTDAHQYLFQPADGTRSAS